MKTSTILLLLTAFLTNLNLFAQNGVYKSTKFEYINKLEPLKNRVEYKTNILTFQINEIHGEFKGGKILWEMNSEGQSEFLEMALIKMKNSFFDEENNAFVKVYDANIMMLGQVISKEDVYITKFISTNIYRLEMVNMDRQTINRFDNIKKL